MRKLIILFILSSIIVKSQDLQKIGINLDNDKINHFSAGYIIAISSNCIAYEISKNKTVGLISGIAFSTLAGYLKENYDKNNNNNFSNSDFLATIYGGLAGTFTVRLILWNSIHRKKATMEQYFLIDN